MSAVRSLLRRVGGEDALDDFRNPADSMGARIGSVMPQWDPERELSSRGALNSQAAFNSGGLN